MIRFTLPLVALLFVGCSEPTGTGLDNVMFTRKTCAQEMTVENQGTAPLRMNLDIWQWKYTSGCDGNQRAQGFKTVAPGATEKLHAELQCVNCDQLSVHYNVTKVSVENELVYDESMGSANVFCSDAACLGR